MAGASNSKIVQREDPILRKKAEPVSRALIGSEKLKSILDEMGKALDSQKDGIAIAAPQVGVPLRMFMVSGDLLKMADSSYKGPGGHLVFVNPEITKLSKERKHVEEGCLSVRWYYGLVKRATRATIRAWDEKGEEIERGASGLLAQIFQHEVDHLEGVLFTDLADEVWEMSEEEIAELQKSHEE